MEDGLAVVGGEEVVGVPPTAGAAVVAHVVPEFGVKVFEVGFILDKDGFGPVLKGNRSKVDVFLVVLLHNGESGADCITVFYMIFSLNIVGKGIALAVVGESDLTGTVVLERTGNGGFPIFLENAVEAFHLGKEEFLLGSPDGLGEGGRGVGGVGSDFVLHGLLSFL